MNLAAWEDFFLKYERKKACYLSTMPQLKKAICSKN